MSINSVIISSIVQLPCDVDISETRHFLAQSNFLQVKVKNSMSLYLVATTKSLCDETLLSVLLYG